MSYFRPTSLRKIGYQGLETTQGSRLLGGMGAGLPGLPGPKGKNPAALAFNLMANPIGLASIARAFEGGSSKASRMGKFSAGVNQAKSAIAIAIKTLIPRATQVVNGIASVVDQVNVISQTAGGSNSLAVSNVMSTISSAQSDAQLAAGTLADTVQRLKDNATVILDADKTGGINPWDPGSPGMVALKDSKEIANQLIGLVQDAQQKLRVLQSAATAASNVVQADATQRQQVASDKAAADQAAAAQAAAAQAAATQAAMPPPAQQSQQQQQQIMQSQGPGMQYQPPVNYPGPDSQMLPDGPVSPSYEAAQGASETGQAPVPVEFATDGSFNDFRADDYSSGSGWGYRSGRDQDFRRAGPESGGPNLGAAPVRAAITDADVNKARDEVRAMLAPKPVSTSGFFTPGKLLLAGLALWFGPKLLSGTAPRRANRRYNRRRKTRGRTA
jgi:hypothetical protein